MAGGVITAGILGLVSKIFGAKSDQTKGMVEVAKIVLEGDAARQDGIKSIAVAEQQYGSFIGRNWRPVTAILFIIHYFAIIHGVLDVPPEVRLEILNFMSAFILGLGGVRSIEKIFNFFTLKGSINNIISKVLK